MSQQMQTQMQSHRANSLDLPPQARRGRAGIVIVLIVSLLASAATRYWADDRREQAIPNRGESGAGTSFSNMNSFALGLLLGGLRGPLVMILWTESETQKAEKNLEGVDTEIEWIRLLQPEFDTVHIFQIWNKAYNISVQMASLANKYTVILGALDYAKLVDSQKPDDINIITAMGQIDFDKLGNSAEKLYYRRRVREESKPHKTATKLRRQDPGWRRTQMDPLLDDNFNLLPNLTTPAPGRERPANLPASAEFNDGSDLQYLAKYSPFPDGVSPFALAYNYYKRAEVLQNVGKQRHAQLSDMVIDSRPGLSLKAWLEEEWEQGRRREAQAYGLPIPDDRSDLEPVAEVLVPGTPVHDRAAAEMAVFAYDRAAKLAPDALAEYLRHLSGNPDNQNTYLSHMDEIKAEAEMAAADRDYLSALLADGPARADLLAKSAAHYRQAIYLYELLVLKYYTDAVYLARGLPPGYSRMKTTDHKGVEDLTPEQADQAMAIIQPMQAGHPDSHTEDAQEYLRYIHRAAVRLTHCR